MRMGIGGNRVGIEVYFDLCFFYLFFLSFWRFEGLRDHTVCMSMGFMPGIWIVLTRLCSVVLSFC